MLARVQPKLAVLPKIFQRLRLEKLIPLLSPQNGGEPAERGRAAPSVQGRPHWSPRACWTPPGRELNPGLSDPPFPASGCQPALSTRPGGDVSSTLEQGAAFRATEPRRAQGPLVGMQSWPPFPSTHERLGLGRTP